MIRLAARSINTYIPRTRSLVFFVAGKQVELITTLSHQKNYSFCCFDHCSGNHFDRFYASSTEKIASMCLQERIVKAMGYRVTWDEEGLPDDLVDNGRKSVGFLGDLGGMIWKTWNYRTSRWWFRKVISCRSLIYFFPQSFEEDPICLDIFQLVPVITLGCFSKKKKRCYPSFPPGWRSIAWADPFDYQPTNQPTNQPSNQPVPHHQHHAVLMF